MKVTWTLVYMWTQLGYDRLNLATRVDRNRGRWCGSQMDISESWFYFTTGWRRLVVVDSCMDTADMETRYLSATTDEEVSYGCLA